MQALGRLINAEENCRQAIALKPDYTEAHNNLGIILQQLGKLNEAETSYRQAIALNPDFAEAHCNLGVTQKELGRVEEAEASFKKAIALRPDFVEAYLDLCELLEKTNKINSTGMLIIKIILAASLTSLFSLLKSFVLYISAIFGAITIFTDIRASAVTVANFTAIE